MLDRIIGALTFRSGVYKEVEQDTTFSPWPIVIVVAFLHALGVLSHTASESFIGWIVGAVVSAIFAVIGFAVSAFVINWAGSSFFNADVTLGIFTPSLSLSCLTLTAFLLSPSLAIASI